MILLCLDGLVVILGVWAIAYAAGNAWKFRKVDTELSRAFSLNLLGEATAGTVTLLFGASQFLGYLDGWGQDMQNIMRLIIMTALIVPSVNLKRIVWRIEHEQGR